MWDEVCKTAMVGTDRATLAATADQPELDALMRSLAAADPTTMVLGTAGALAVRDMAGYRVQANDVPLPPNAPMGQRPVCSSTAAGLLRAALAERDRALVMLWVEVCLAAGQRPPDVLLPSLMQFTHTDILAWDKILPLVGERGVWLAREFDERSNGQVVLRRLTGEITDDDWWDAYGTGMMEVTFQAYRFWHPAAAREALRRTLFEKRPRFNDRLPLVKALEINLSADDEPLLELLLDDRAKTVAETAADYLARLPGSAYVGRMRALAEGMVSLERVRPKLKEIVAGQAAYDLTLNTHHALSDAMKRDRLDRGNVYGLKAHELWMYNVVRALPPAHWEKQFGLSTSETIAFIRKSAKSHLPNNYLWTGVRKALEYHGNLAWARAWLQEAIAAFELLPPQPQPEQRLAAIAGTSWTEAQVSAWFQAALRDRDRRQVQNLGVKLGLVPGPWSEMFSRDLVAFMVAVMRDDKLRSQAVLPLFVADRLNPGSVDDAYRLLTAVVDENRALQHMHKHLDTLLMTVKRRQAILDAFKG